MKQKSVLWEIFDYIFFFFFPKKEKLCGKLVVSGKGALEFKFQQYLEDIFVYFDDENLPTPCNPCDPGKEDELNWHIYYRHGHYFLVISWDVASQQTIKWHIHDVLCAV